jgi:hypothetical protein
MQKDKHECMVLRLQEIKKKSFNVLSGRFFAKFCTNNQVLL